MGGFLLTPVWAQGPVQGPSRTMRTSPTMQGKADPAGRFWCGSIGPPGAAKSEPSILFIA